ncbi:MAG: hypothetical protein AB1861_15755 [Cyanobacteriota bacterium]
MVQLERENLTPQPPSLTPLTPPASGGKIRKNFYSGKGKELFAPLLAGEGLGERLTKMYWGSQSDSNAPRHCKLFCFFWQIVFLNTGTGTLNRETLMHSKMALKITLKLSVQNNSLGFLEEKAKDLCGVFSPA